MGSNGTQEPKRLQRVGALFYSLLTLKPSERQQSVIIVCELLALMNGLLMTIPLGFFRSRDASDPEQGWLVAPTADDGRNALAAVGFMLCAHGAMISCITGIFVAATGHHASADYYATVFDSFTALLLTFYLGFLCVLVLVNWHTFAAATSPWVLLGMILPLLLFANWGDLRVFMIIYKHAPLEVFHAHKFLMEQMAGVWPCVLNKFIKDEPALKRAAENRAAEIRARIAWDWALIVFVLYSAVSVPMEVCFRYEKHISISMFDRFVDVFFFCDLLINFRTAFVKGDGTFEIEPTLIARKYLCTWFFFDLLATVPFDLLTGNAAGTNSLGLAKMPRMLRIFRLLKKLDMLTAARAMRMLSVVVFFLVFTHCIACFWWMVGVSMKEKGWQFQDEIVPLLLQDIDWVSQAQPSMRLAAEPTISVDLSRPGWLPSQYNATELLDMYETEVQLGKVYMTSLYWALTMVMKSPWLPPRSSGEQAYACVCVVFGAIAFAWFLGHVTTMIQSFEKSNALYRDGMTLVHNFFNERNLSSASRKAILAYTDAYFKTRVQGVEVQRIVASMPAHIRPAVLMEVHQALIESCPWLHECTYSGCAAFLEQLRPEVCLKGDCILRAGVISELFYILISGELQVSFPPDGAKNRKITQLFGSRLAAGQVDDGHKQSSRIPQGRIERCGSLIGWQPPFGAIYPLRYTMRAFRFTQLLSITRVDIASVLRKHTVDAAIFQKAVEHADKTLMPTRRGGGTRPPSSDSRCSLTINDARSASQLRMAAGPVKNAADALMADALGGSPTRVSKAERRASEADPANGKSDKEMQAEGWLPAARPKDDGGAPTAAVATAPSPTPPPAAAAAMPPSQPLPPTSPSQQGVAFAAAGDGGEADGGGESRKTQGWSDFVFGMGGGVQGGGGGGLEAWMREREQAEAELRAEVHDLREEIRSGFRMIALQLGDVKSDVKRGATFKAVEA